jgi:hypothetical protein
MYFIFTVQERSVVMEGESIYDAMNKIVKALHVERNAIHFQHDQLKDVIVSEGTHDPLALLQAALPFTLEERMERRARTATAGNAAKRWTQVYKHLERLAPRGYYFGVDGDAYGWYSK